MLLGLPNRIARRAYLESVWYLKYQWNPFNHLPMSLSVDVPGVQAALGAAGIPFEPFHASPAGFRSFLGRCGYPPDYHGGKGTGFTEKCFEHYLSMCMLDLDEDDDYIDLASDRSPFPGFVRAAVGCDVFVNDLSYPAGITDGWRIGSDATSLPLPDGSLSKATLHCSLEHFEGDSDSRLIRELARVLRPGGKVCILPFYLHTQYVGLTDPFVDRTGCEWDPAMTPVVVKGHGQRQGRYYDSVQLKKRIYSQLGSLQPTLYNVENLDDIASGLWCNWVLVLEQPRP